MPKPTTAIITIPSHLERHIDRVRLQVFSGTKHAYLCGVALREARPDCLQGEWLPFLEAVGIPQRTAHHWMSAADMTFPDLSFDQAEAELANLANLPPLITSGKAPRAGDHDGNDEWYTPAGVVGAARAVMGRIDLDPASTSEANETVKAKTIYTVEDDGLTKPWRGRVFLNPPFSAQLKRAFCDRLRESVASGDVKQAVLVTPIDISPQWGDVIRTGASAVALAVGSTPFYGPRGERGGPGFGHMVSYYGPHVGRFASVFGKEEWSVWVRPTEH